MVNNTGGPAFPGFDYIAQSGKQNPEGMTLRDYFAAKAMQAELMGGVLYEHDFGITAKRAYTMADAMLRAREQK